MNEWLRRNEPWLQLVWRVALIALLALILLELRPMGDDVSRLEEYARRFR